MLIALNTHSWLIFAAIAAPLARALFCGPTRRLSDRLKTTDASDIMPQYTIYRSLTLHHDGKQTGTFNRVLVGQP